SPRAESSAAASTIPIPKGFRNKAQPRNTGLGFEPESLRDSGNEPVWKLESGAIMGILLSEARATTPGFSSPSGSRNCETSCRTRPFPLSTRSWFWIGVTAVALVGTGQRLALPQRTPHLLRFAHTFTTESERAIVDEAVAEFEKSHPGLRIDQIIS